MNISTKNNSRPAFALPIVFIVLMIAMFMIVTVTQLYDSYVARTSNMLEHQQEYNLLVNGVEKGRNYIRANDYPQLPTSDTAITTASSLILHSFSYTDKLGSKNATVSVQIYDSKIEGNSSRLEGMKSNPSERVKMPTLTVPQTANLVAADEGTNPNTGSGGVSGKNENLRVYTIRARVEGVKGTRTLELLTTMDSQ